MSALEPDAELVGVVNDVFAGLSAAAKHDGGIEDAWSSVADLGFTLVGVPERAGGSGGSLHDGLAVLRAAAHHTVALPLAENAGAAWLLAESGREVDGGPLSIAPADLTAALQVSAGKATGVADDVPWGRDASLVAALAGDSLILIDPADCEVNQGQDLAGQPRDTLILSSTPVEIIPTKTNRDDFFWRMALLRVAQISGALAALDERTRRYTQERIQFGKPIGAFQSVQQHIVTIAQAAECSTAALWQAATAVERRPAPFECCAAKLMADESARVAVRAAHQAHGAIGVTQEYPLHELTRRLNTWRFDFGTEQELSELLGRAVADADSFAHSIFDNDNKVALSCQI